MTFQPRSSSVAGCTIHYLEAGSGSPVLFLHGGGGVRVDEEAWQGLAARHRLIAASLPGFDQSTLGAVASAQDMADVVAPFIREVAGGAAAVIGESFGGMIGGWVAIRHPDVVTHLVLAAPAGLRQEGGPSLQQLSREELSELLFGRPPTASPDPEQIERTQRNRQTVARVSQGRPAFDPDFHEQLAGIQAPTLILWGTADKMTWPTQAHLFEERIPHARLVLIEGAPHALSAAVPQDFLEAVLPFLESGSERPASITGGAARSAD